VTDCRSRSILGMVCFFRRQASWGEREYMWRFSPLWILGEFEPLNMWRSLRRRPWQEHVFKEFLTFSSKTFLSVVLYSQLYEFTLCALALGDRRHNILVTFYPYVAKKKKKKMGTLTSKYYNFCLYTGPYLLSFIICKLCYIPTYLPTLPLTQSTSLFS